jgi:hypothetical protein
MYLRYVFRQCVFATYLSYVSSLMHLRYVSLFCILPFPPRRVPHISARSLRQMWEISLLPAGDVSRSIDPRGSKHELSSTPPDT